MSMNYCPICHTRFPDFVWTCPECGYELEQDCDD